MIKYDNIMLDLETFGNGPSALIASIGAVFFSVENGIGPHIHLFVEPLSAAKAGGVIDPGTVIWWMEQNDAARLTLTEEIKHGLPIFDALTTLKRFITERSEPDVKVWGNGSSFDNVILTSAFDNSNISQPWKFYNDRCYRTLKNLHPAIKLKRHGTHHNALHDAISQASHAIEILRYINAQDISNKPQTLLSRLFGFLK
jgi:hypothetical protein